MIISLAESQGNYFFEEAAAIAAISTVWAHGRGTGFGTGHFSQKQKGGGCIDSKL